MERIFLISDIHIGNPQFDNEKPLIEFLNNVKTKATGLVINGDFLDFQQGPPAKILIDFDSVLAKFFELVHNHFKLWYVIGNHDILLQDFVVNSELVNILYPRLDLTVGGRQIHIEHGHLYDQYYRRMPWLYNLGSRILGLGLRFNPQLGDQLGSLFNKLQTAHHKFAITPASPDYQGDFSEYETGARGLLTGRDRNHRPPVPPDVVIFGHTHRPLAAEIEPGRLYINSGCWIKHASYVELSDEGIFTGDWKAQGRERVATPHTTPLEAD